VLRYATTVTVASEHRSKASPISFAYATEFLRGLASIRARQLQTDLVIISLAEDRHGDRPLHVSEMPTDVSEGGAGALEMVDPDSGLPVEVKALLFADAKGFGAFTDEAIPLFVEHFLGLVARVTESCRLRPASKNTWGDGLYMVFHDVRDAARFALALREEVERTDWKAHGLPEKLTLRIALHAGPVYRCADPVTGIQGYFGAHVSSAARIEPITPPGEVYGSQAFAAMLALRPVSDVSCTYVGNTAWAKGYGSFPTFHVRRT
jgi:class 3 adenylate cyclase